MIRFACPGCSAVLAIPDKAIGKKGRCPKCGQRLQIPSAPSSPRDRTVLGTNTTVESGAGSDFPVSSAKKDWPQAEADASPSQTSPDWKDLDDGPAKRPKGSKIGTIALGFGVLAIVFVAIIVLIKAKELDLGGLPFQLTWPSSSLTEVDRNALLLADAREWKKAFSVIERAITDEPSRASHWYTRGSLHFKWGNYSEAMHDFDIAVQLAPDWPEAQKMLGLAKKEEARERRKRKMEWTEQELRRERELLIALKVINDDIIKSESESVRNAKERIRVLEDEYRRLKAGQ